MIIARSEVEFRAAYLPREWKWMLEGHTTNRESKAGDDELSV